MNVPTVSSEAKIFLSYRREDSAGYARLLYDRLASRFPDRVFMDISGIGLGVDFVNSIRGAIDASGVFIALIGTHWLTSKGSDGQLRLHNAGDFVRIEIRTALERGLTVIPVLLPGAVMPSAEDLPQDITALANRQALQVTDADLDQNVRMLIRTLESELRSSSTTTRQLIIQSLRIAIPVSAILAAISDLMLSSTALTPRVAIAFGTVALPFIVLRFTGSYIDPQRWPQLIRSQYMFLRIGVFLFILTVVFALLAIAQRVSGVASDKGILATKISILATVKATMFASKRSEGSDSKRPPSIEEGNDASSPFVNAMPSNSGWLIDFNVPDRHPKEILFKLNKESTFTSTGFSHTQVDSVTGLPRPNYSVTIPHLVGANVISLKYVDEHGQERGPFLIPLDIDKRYVIFTKDVLDSLPQWVSFREYPRGRLLVYFTGLVSYKNAFREIRYSVDNDSLSQKLAFIPDWDSPDGPRITEKDQTYIEVPLTTKFVCVKLFYTDNTESPAKKFSLTEAGVTKE